MSEYFLSGGDTRLSWCLSDTHEDLWQYQRDGVDPIRISSPVLNIDGADVSLRPQSMSRIGEVATLANGCREASFGGVVRADPRLYLKVTFRIAEQTPVVRWRFTVQTTGDAVPLMTKPDGQDRLTYFKTDLAKLPRVTEVRLGEFQDASHSFCLTERRVRDADFLNGVGMMGPILVAANGEPGTMQKRCVLLAYEHGSQLPNSFLRFEPTPSREVALRAVKGNYWGGRQLSVEQPFQSVWFQIAAIADDVDAMAACYREFVLRYMAVHHASRTPSIFYNTWCLQERSRWWKGGQYLDPMHEARMLAEIDVAARIGIEVFVIDAGWFEKTGDWKVSPVRFPRGLDAIRSKLASYGMKLGLWFDNAAAVSSVMMARHEHCRISHDGIIDPPMEVWETEASQRMCLVSEYADAFADDLIRLNRELGVTHFKWDAIEQYGCDDPGHRHGPKEATAQERRDGYAFELCASMVRIAEKLAEACPEVIVDFDITEGGRCVGLGFLAAGKYFVVNNGPYFHDLDVSMERMTGKKQWSNVFVNPGPARARVCRAPLSYDRWIPSVLFLTHYLPDDPADSQLVNLASLVLGQNGIWGDLLAISEEGVKRLNTWLVRYKAVRESVTGASPIRAGDVGGSPEIHEKIDPVTGRGLLSVFAGAAGNYTYVTSRKPARDWAASEGATVDFDASGSAVVRLTFKRPDASLIIFGAGNAA